VSDDEHRHPHFEEVFEEHPCVDVVHGVPFDKHTYEFVAQNECDDDTRYRYDDVLRQIANHGKYGVIPESLLSRGGVIFYINERINMESRTKNNLLHFILQEIIFKFKSYSQGKSLPLN
jgi:hypothetical protein